MNLTYKVTIFYVKLLNIVYLCKYDSVASSLFTTDASPAWQGL